MHLTCSKLLRQTCIILSQTVAMNVILLGASRCAGKKYSINVQVALYWKPNIGYKKDTIIHYFHVLFLPKLARLGRQNAKPRVPWHRAGMELMHWQFLDCYQQAQAEKDVCSCLFLPSGCPANIGACCNPEISHIIGLTNSGLQGGDKRQFQSRWFLIEV